MRPTLVVLLSVFTLGTVYGYSRLSEWLKPDAPKFQYDLAEGNYQIKVTVNYEVPQSDDGNLAVTLNGEVVLTNTSSVKPMQTIVIDKPMVRAGRNHLFVAVHPPKQSEASRDAAIGSFLDDEEPISPNADNASAFQCVRVQVFRDGLQLDRGDVTVHLDSGSSIAADLFFDAFLAVEVDHQH